MDNRMFGHADLLKDATQGHSLSAALAEIHKQVKARFVFIDRIAMVIYDPATDLLKTLAHSSGSADPLSNYEAKLADTESLKQILDRKQPRVVNDMAVFAAGTHEHTKRIRAQGYGASYTMPLYLDGGFAGFVFFDSYQKNVFSEEVLQLLDLYGHLIGLLLINQIANTRTLQATIKSAIDMVHEHDFETGSHIVRMANYSRLIARELAPKYALDDEYIENIFRFSPMHDIGKIAIPDRILMKPGKLTDEERQVMKTHTTKGGEIIDDMLKNFGLEGLPHIDVLRNIALHHHEAVNGNGYPDGLKGSNIPLEARIAAVADVFDALTSRRRYKEAWRNEDAFAALRNLAGEQFDRDCVEALLRHQAEVEQIQHRFQETTTI